MKISVEDLQTLLERAKQSGKLEAWSDLAMDFARSANAEVERLTAELAKFNEGEMG